MAETSQIPPEAEELLTSEPLVAHLATCRDGKPHAAPIWFRVADDGIEVAIAGRKLDNVRENPRVALSIQRDEDGHPQWGVTVRGTATIVDDEAESEELNRRLNEKYGVDEDAWEGNTGVRIDVGSVDHWTYG
jgi:PPOX class probable F420-dependent enzyme